MSLDTPPPPHPMWRRVTDDYWVSKEGLVWSTVVGRTLRTKLSKTGYEIIVLKRLGTRSIHTLVAEAWLGEKPSAHHVVDHVDGCKTNNHVSNLEWVSRKANTGRAVALGLVSSNTGRNFVLSAEQVYQARKAKLAGASIASIAAEVGVAPATVRSAVYGLSYAELVDVPPLPLPREPGTWRPGAGGKRHEGPRAPVDGHPKDFIDLLPGEAWQRLHGSVSGYWVSDQGRVFSAKSRGLKKPVVNTKQQNYLRVQLRSNEGRYESFMLHRLVAEYFLPPKSSDELVIGHLNENPQDCRASNLAWISRRENAVRASIASRRTADVLELQDFVASVVPVERMKKIANTTADIYVPSSGLVVQYDQVKLAGEVGGGIPRPQRVADMDLLWSKHGIKTIRVFSTEWEQKKDLVKSMLLHKLGRTRTKVYARHTGVREVTTKESTAFLDKNHLQGAVGGSVKLGCYLHGNLVALAVFGVPRFGNTQPGSYELIRYANEMGCSVVGGFSKILARFIKDHSPRHIISFADRRWSSGGLYEASGFKQTRVTAPNYFYFNQNDTTLRSRVQFQKHKLPQLLSSFDPTKSEVENMKANGWDRIWDCGNLVYEMTAPDGPKAGL